MNDHNRSPVLRGLDGNTFFNVRRGGKPSRSPRSSHPRADFEIRGTYAEVLRADAPRVPTGPSFGRAPHTAPRATPSVAVPRSSVTGSDADAARAAPELEDSDVPDSEDERVEEETHPASPVRGGVNLNRAFDGAARPAYPAKRSPVRGLNRAFDGAAVTKSPSESLMDTLSGARYHARERDAADHAVRDCDDVDAGRAHNASAATAYFDQRRGASAHVDLTNDFAHAAPKRTRSPTKRALSPKGKRARAPASGRALSPGAAARNCAAYAKIGRTYFENRDGRQNREDDADDFHHAPHQDGHDGNGNYYYPDDDFNEEETDAARTRRGFDFRAPDENENDDDDVVDVDDDDDGGARAPSPPRARPTGRVDDDRGARPPSPPRARPTGRPGIFPGASRTYATVPPWGSRSNDPWSPSRARAPSPRASPKKRAPPEGDGARGFPGASRVFATSPRRGNDPDAVRAFRTMCPTRRFGSFDRVRSSGTRARPGQYVDLRANMANEFNINKDAAQNFYKGAGVSAAAAAAAAANPETAQRAFASNVTGNLGTKTLHDYERKWKYFFMPYYNHFCAHIRIQIPDTTGRRGEPVYRNHTIADLTEDDVMLWVQFELIDKGRMSGSSARQCLISVRGVWPLKMQLKGYRVRGVQNPFSTEAVRKMQTSLGARIKKVQDTQLPRTALEPKFFAGILMKLLVTVDLFKACFGLNDYREYKPNNFKFTEFELARNMMAVMIGYMFGLRASNLFELELDDIKIILPDTPRGPRTLALKKLTCKNFSRNEFSEPRVLPPGQCSDVIAECYIAFLTMKRYMYSYRMIEQPSGDTMNPANFIPFDNEKAHQTEFASASELDKFLERIGDARTVSEGGVWSIPGEYVAKDKAVKVTSWLRSSLKAAELLHEATKGRSLSSHVIRSGAASAFVCVNPELLVKAKFHFGWAFSSDVIEENYIAHSWTPRAHPDAMFFWGDWKDLGY